MASIPYSDNIKYVGEENKIIRTSVVNYEEKMIDYNSIYVKYRNVYKSNLKITKDNFEAKFEKELESRFD